MTEIENGHITNQVLPPEVSQDFDQRISRDEKIDQEIYDRLVSDVSNVISCDDKSDPDYKSAINHSNEWCKVTLLPRLVINDQLLVPLKTCYRLVAFQETIEQDEKRKEVSRNYIPSSVLTEAELYLRLETIWWLDKITGNVSSDATRKKVNELDDEPGGVEEVDLNYEYIPDGVYVHDSSDEGDTGNEGGEALEVLDAPEKKNKKTGSRTTVRKVDWNESKKKLVWHYE